MSDEPDRKRPAEVIALPEVPYTKGRPHIGCPEEDRARRLA